MPFLSSYEEKHISFFLMKQEGLPPTVLLLKKLNKLTYCLYKKSSGNKEGQKENLKNYT
jgi:hypothetical protein